MSWSRDLQISDCTWSSHVSLIITQPARDLLTSSFHPKILHASTSSSLPPLWTLLRTVSILLQSHLSYQLGYQSALALSEAEVLRVACEPNKQFALIVGSRNDHLQINAFPNLMVVEQEEYPSYSTKDSHWRSHEWRCKRDNWPDAARPDFWDVNISFYQAFLAAELHRSRCFAVTMQG